MLYVIENTMNFNEICEYFSMDEVRQKQGLLAVKKRSSYQGFYI